MLSKKYYDGNIKESGVIDNRKPLKEATRNTLLRKSRNAKKYTGKTTGRWEAKGNCKVANTVKDYNKINMDNLWKNDILTFDIKVAGETGDYIVTLEFQNVIKYIQQKVKGNKNLLDKKTIYDGLVAGLNSSDVKISCNCPDFKYRHSYQASKNGYKAGPQETRASEKTNPNDTLGAACKHVLCALNNASWIRNVASVINNYINYAKDNMENLYSKYIFPKIYGIAYNKAVQMSIFDFDDAGNEKSELESKPELINLANAIGKTRGRFTKGSNRNPVNDKRSNESLDESFDNPATLARHFADHCDPNNRKSSTDSHVYFSEFADEAAYYAAAKKLAGSSTLRNVSGKAWVVVNNKYSHLPETDPKRYLVQYAKWTRNYSDRASTKFSFKKVIYCKLLKQGKRDIITFYATRSWTNILNRNNVLYVAELPEEEQNVTSYNQPFDIAKTAEFQNNLIKEYIRTKVANTHIANTDLDIDVEN